MKHNGINATRDVLKDQLVLAADGLIAAKRENLRLVDSAEAYRLAYAECRKIAEDSNRVLSLAGLVMALTGLAGFVVLVVL